MQLAAKRFWAKVATPSASECWEWTASRHPDGYGRFGFHGVIHHAHRIAWVFRFGEIPPELSVLHHCDNPPCCNPAHLFLGTQQDNIRDMVQKGRQRGAPALRNGWSKFSRRDVLGFRDLRARGKSLKEIARIFGVSVSMIERLSYGRTYRDVA